MFFFFFLFVISFGWFFVRRMKHWRQGSSIRYLSCFLFIDACNFLTQPKHCLWQVSFPSKLNWAVYMFPKHWYVDRGNSINVLLITTIRIIEQSMHICHRHEDTGMFVKWCSTVEINEGRMGQKFQYICLVLLSLTIYIKTKQRQGQWVRSSALLCLV